MPTLLMAALLCASLLRLGLRRPCRSKVTKRDYQQHRLDTRVESTSKNQGQATLLTTNKRAIRSVLHSQFSAWIS